MTRCGYCGALYEGECYRCSPRVTEKAVTIIPDRPSLDGEAPRGRGRPRKAEALSGAERVRRHRQRKAASATS